MTLALTVRVEEAAETLYANAAEDAEHIALVVVELGGCFSAEGKEVITEESLYAC